MWTDAIQFRNSTSPELCKIPAKAATMMKESPVGKRKLNTAGTAILKGIYTFLSGMSLLY